MNGVRIIGNRRFLLPIYLPSEHALASSRQDLTPNLSLHAVLACRAYPMPKDLIRQSAELFSSQYGVWGPEAAKHKGPSYHQGRRVRMSPSRLRATCVPNEELNYMVVAMHRSELGESTMVAYSYVICYDSGTE